MAQSHGSSLWREPAGSGAVPSVTHMVLRDDGSSEWDAIAGTDAQVKLLDVGNGEYLTVEVDAPWVITDNGTEYFPASSGTAAAVLADDGGNLVVAAVGAAVAGQLYLDAGNGDVAPARLDADERQLVQVGTTEILTY